MNDNETSGATTDQTSSSGNEWYPDMYGLIRIPLYTIIFVMSIVGNSLVIITLVKNRRMRVVTNVYLLNLAVADLLLGTFCMPFTLAGSLLREFIFGAVMCKIIPYCQAVSVCVSVWTLVVISLERYFAVCEPLKSRTKWQNLSHAYKIIATIWILSFLGMIPTAVVNKLVQSSSTGKHRCREIWPSRQASFGFSITLDVVMLAVPILIMTSAYANIMYTLWKGINIEKLAAAQEKGDVEMRNCPKTQTSPFVRRYMKISKQGSIVNNSSIDEPESNPKGLYSHGVRQSNLEKSLKMKRKVIRMLIVVVFEFFICWTPIFVINSLNSNEVQIHLQGLGVSIIHLLAYASSCCNPITYCFMNQHFRNSFVKTFKCTSEAERLNWKFRANTEELRNIEPSSSRRPTLKTTVHNLR